MILIVARDVQGRSPMMATVSKTRKLSFILIIVIFVHAVTVLVTRTSLIDLDFDTRYGAVHHVQKYQSDARNKTIHSADEVTHRGSGQLCNLFSESTAPSPVILLALGRSGSSITWDALSKLTGRRNVAYEITGGNQHRSVQFFNNLVEEPLTFYNWTLQRLCLVQQRRRSNISHDTGIVGFQWKPYMSTFNHEYAIEGLKAVAAQRFKDPVVRMIYLTRNPLDRKLSNIRHTQSKESHAKISAHCSTGDETCVRKHAEFNRDIVFPTGEELMKFLSQNERHEEIIIERLDKLHVPYVKVTYEKLYNNKNDDAEEWMRLFRFLGRGPSEGLKMDDVRSAFSIAATHKRSRNASIANFEDVRKTLAGTRYENLLAD